MSIENYQQCLSGMQVPLKCGDLRFVFSRPDGTGWTKLLVASTDHQKVFQAHYLLREQAKDVFIHFKQSDDNLFALEVHPKSEWWTNAKISGCEIDVFLEHLDKGKFELTALN